MVWSSAGHATPRGMNTSPVCGVEQHACVSVRHYSSVSGVPAAAPGSKPGGRPPCGPMRGVAAPHACACARMRPHAAWLRGCAPLCCAIALRGRWMPSKMLPMRPGPSSTESGWERVRQVLAGCLSFPSVAWGRQADHVLLLKPAAGWSCKHSAVTPARRTFLVRVTTSPTVRPAVSSYTWRRGQGWCVSGRRCCEISYREQQCAARAARCAPLRRDRRLPGPPAAPGGCL